ncbi:MULTISPECIES: NYN domain-containing protein [unclassified Gemella]|uniref:NYN domain-containing protein n=1 Tax=unclassified Gemella TaxID=2624949 RepID=UPI001C04B009|nr:MULTISPECIES: NYN domain-containing protein [unclassified Gemella]MBU0278392.1 NYN domain-containing protein [Gemella sp. zg-1178]QWQ38990.1 NYN domain-containing protein [Gemella sp. zg-570]
MKNQYLIIDGYNLLFKLKEYSKIKSSAFQTERDSLIEILKEYASGNNYKVYCVFDAYKNGNKEYIKEENPIYIVYTKNGEDADRWIERKTKELYINHFVDVIVVSDDRDERDSALGYGAILRDCHRFIKDLYDRKNQMSKYIKKHNETRIKNRNIRISAKDRKKLEQFLLTGKKFNN